MAILHLADRSLVKLSGADVEPLLQRLITTDIDDVAIDAAGYGALLSPQGKILFDFLVSRLDGGAFLFDLNEVVVADFIKKMTLYRMRSDVTIEPVDMAVGVDFEPDLGKVQDPRGAELGWRSYDKANGWDVDQNAINDYNLRLIEAGVPTAGLDFAFGDAFPHDVNMDYLGGLDFQKGCYVGQEVVSRMEHRGTARKRLVRVQGNASLPKSGTDITANGKKIGELGNVQNKNALAIVRLDRADDAANDAIPLLADNVELKLLPPHYALDLLGS